MSPFATLLARKDAPLLIGVVHLAPTPGSPGYDGNWPAALEAGRADARAYLEGGADALIVENFGDVPFARASVEPECIAAMALALEAVRAEVGELPLGVNVLRNDARAAVGLCATTTASFLRVNVHCGAMVTDQGVIEGEARSTLTARSRLCPEATLLADVHVKHASPLGNESLVQAARDTRLRGLADGLILSGTETGTAGDPLHFERVREGLPDTPLFLGSGLDADNAGRFLPWIRGAIVASSLKEGGHRDARVSAEKVRRLRGVFDS